MSEALIQLQRFLLDDQPYPVGELASLVAYALKHQPERLGNIFWLPKKESFEFKGEKFSIPLFRFTIMTLIQQAAELTKELLHVSSWKRDPFQGRTEMQLMERLKDDHSEYKRNYSFVTDERNTNLLAGLQKFLFQVIIEDDDLRKRYFWANQTSGQYGWNSEAVEEYLSKTNTLLELILLLIHLTSGQPGRGTEILDLNIWNSPHRARNIYIAGGRIMIVTW